MNSALKCTLMVAIGVVAFALPAMAGVNTTPTTMPEPSTIILLAGGLVTVIGARKLRKK
jgi:hypothetical protein